MHRWMAAFPNPNLDTEDDEVIYEDWGNEAQTRTQKQFNGY